MTEYAHHDLSIQLYNSIISYWNYKTFQEIYKLRQKYVEKAKLFYNNILLLIESDLKAKAEIYQLSANLSQKQVELLQAEEYLLDSKNILCSFLGITLEQFLTYDSEPDNYPEIISEEILSDLPLSPIIENTLKNRKDLMAAKLDLDATNLLVRSAKANLLPDLTLNARYQVLLTQQNELYDPNSFKDNKTDDFNIYLTFTVPFGNHVAKGKYLSNKAINEKARINLQMQQELISLNVNSAYNSLVKTSKSLAFTTRAAQDMKKVYSNEKIRYDKGSTTLLELLLIQDQMILAEINLLLMNNTYSQAIAKYRYETGQLVHQNKIIDQTNFNKIVLGIDNIN